MVAKIRHESSVSIVHETFRTMCVVLLACVVAACQGGEPRGAGRDAGSSPPNRHLLIVLDGLRPDYVTPEVMPNLHALGQRGVVMTRHHAVFPTVTRVNASSIATGAYPGAHGLMGNSVFFPQVDPSRFLNTGERSNLLRVSDAVGGELLTTPTLGEMLQASGKRVLIVSSGSSGSSFLLNHTVAGGAIIHYEHGLPEAIHEKTLELLGDAPTVGMPSDARNRWAVDAFLGIGLPEIDPAVTLMWLTDPDATAHQHGMGHPTTVEALARVDAEIERIRDGLADAGLLDVTNIWITSDHGFSDHTSGVDLTGLLEPFAGTLSDGSPRIVTGGGAIYVRDDDETTVAEIVAAIQATRGLGAVFTRGGNANTTEGWVPGTLSFEVAHWDHPRSADVLVSADWTDEANEYGYRGTSAQGGTAGHGSSSPFDIRATLIAAGPDVKEGVTVEVPSGNVDLAPTFLHLLGIDIPASVQGRVLTEAVIGGPDPTAIQVETNEITVANANRTYVLTAVVSTVAGRRYLDYTTVERPE